MITFKRNILSLFLFTLCFLFGVIASYYYYYPSEYSFVYWIFAFALVCFSVLSKIYTQTVGKRDFALIILILLFYLLGWSLVPQDLRFGAFLLSSFCFLYSSSILLKTDHRTTKALVVMFYLISALNIVPILLYITQKSLITREIISTVFISNIQESKEYVWANFSYQHLIVLLVFIVASFFFLLSKEKETSVRISRNVFLLFFISFLCLGLSGPIGALSSEYGSYLYQKKKLKNMVELRAKGLSELKFSINKKNSHAAKIVVVIGESLNRSYMGLYGYNRNTTPNLSRMLSDSSGNGSLFVFDNVISPEVYTVPALSKVLTNTNNQNEIPFEKSVSIIDLFKKANFETYWISNQAPLGKNDTPISVISHSADSLYFSASEKNKNDGAPLGTYYDGVLLKPFRNIISQKQGNKNQIYFIHLMGSHVNYEDRYPSNFNVFKIPEPKNAHLYLNSIIYGDWVVSSIINIANENNVDVVCYFSDHGDELGYGHNPSNYKRGMSLVPFVVYLSKEYAGKNPDLVKQLIANKHTPAMTDNFFNDIQGISGISSSLYEPNNSFISNQYIFQKRFVVNKTIPFDE